MYSYFESFNANDVSFLSLESYENYWKGLHFAIFEMEDNIGFKFCNPIPCKVLLIEGKLSKWRKEDKNADKVYIKNTRPYNTIHIRGASEKYPTCV